VAYIALNSNEIMVYSIQERKTLITHPSWQNEEVIYIQGVKTLENSYVMVVYRTASILYKVQKTKLQKISTYIINSKKTPSYKIDLNNKHQNNSRFYFTSANIRPLFDERTINKYDQFLEKLQTI
jgi:hypothetical protein